jgi:hypothetical protein
LIVQSRSPDLILTNYFKHIAKLRNMLAVLLEELPEEIQQREEV